MKFRNVTEDDRFIPSLHLLVAPNETTPDLEDDVAEGFIAQTDVWVSEADQKEVVADQAETTEQES